MKHPWRIALATFFVASLVMVASVAVLVGGGNGRTAASRPVVEHLPATIAAASRTADATIPPVPDTTVAPPATTTPTTTPPTTAPPATAAPTTAAPRPAAPRVTPATAARPPVSAPQAAVITNSGGGSTSDFSLIGYRWNPCQVITVASTGPDVSGIVSELASITGLHLQMVSGKAMITVQWGAVPPGGEIGLTAWRAVGSWLTQAGIIISPQAQPYLATVLRHELGHAVGLNHAGRSDEIMYPTVSHSSPTDYQAGDRTGLSKIGASAGC